jgi:hypothetical protein
MSAPLLHWMLLIVGLTAGALAVGHVADAQPVTTGPTVGLDRYEMAPGDRVVLTLGGFESRSVVISVCGNDARRGSTDCNMPESEGLGIDPSRKNTVSSIPVAVPPTPCPCLIRVSSATNDEVAVAAITLIGHPVAPVVGTPGIGEPLAVSITARASPDGFLGWARSSLGGATTYEVTVTVRNRSTQTQNGIVVVGSAGRDAENELVTLAVSDPGSIEPGQTWREVISADLPAPVYGRAEWRVVATGAGPATAASEPTSHQPLLLIVLMVVFVVDFVVLMARFVRRRRRRTSLPPVDDVLDRDALEPSMDDRVSELVTR